MSHILWKYYLEDNVDKFEAFLLGSSSNAQPGSKHSAHNAGFGHVGSLGVGASVGGGGGGGSPATGQSPRNNFKSRKSSGMQGTAKGGQNNGQLGRGDINSRDRNGCTILHHAASSATASGMRFATALIEHAQTDIYLQDFENGWTALHRACYFGNAYVARLLLARDLSMSPSQSSGASTFRGNSLIKIKDSEGNSAFDVYNATIARRTVGRAYSQDDDVDDEDEHDSDSITGNATSVVNPHAIDGDEVFAFGSNKNLTLGFGDEDDRQYPERLTLKRPDHLLRRFHRESLIRKRECNETLFSSPASLKESDPISELPALIRNKPIIIEDVALSKLHSAILTTDPESNLHMCGFGPGGRLGTGDETTRFSYSCIEGGALAGKKVSAVALGLNHTLAISSEGDIYSWGTNTFGQLGYSLPVPLVQDEEPINSSPRQIFGPLKREIIIGVACSGVHSVAHTSSALFTWGKNNGQLGLMDSDSRSLDQQIVPRRVAASLFSSSILMVSAIDRATIVLLANHSVCVFTNYGYNYVKFPIYEGFKDNRLNALTTRYEADAYISTITSNGDTIAALSSRGDLFTITVTQNPGASAASTTNPSKIKNALSSPQRIWSLRNGNWDGVKSVAVGENGSVIICTKAGAVYRRISRVKIRDALTRESKKKDFKFQRVPGLTNVVAVRSSAFGTYAAIRKDCDVAKTQIHIDEQSLWTDLAPLLSIKGFRASEPDTSEESSAKRFWTPGIDREAFEPFKAGVLTSPSLEKDVAEHVASIVSDDYDLDVASSLSDTTIPVHAFLLASRSTLLQRALAEFAATGSFEVSDLLTLKSVDGRKRLEFQGVDFLTILNLTLYAYEDEVIDVWHFTRHVPDSAYRFRQVRTELMKVAGRLGMHKLEASVRLMIKPELQLHVDLAAALCKDTFFDDGDTIVELDGDEIRAHSALLTRRCPFFQGLFGGRAGGQWLAQRREAQLDAVRIDLKHIEPSVFELVMRHLYADVGIELFDEVVADDLDELCDLVMDVLAVANELMLDRLSQICQYTIAQFSNTRNMCHLLNAVAPVAVTEFKDAGLEYLCLQLECMLENQLLDDLDEDLLLELDDVVRDNQLACLPFAKSGRAELLLHEKHPELSERLDKERQRRIRDLAFRAQARDEDARLSASFKNRVGSLDDMMSSSPQEKGRRASKGRNTPFSPALRPKDSAADLIFEMEDDDAESLGAISPGYKSPNYTTTPTVGRISGNASPAPGAQAGGFDFSKQQPHSLSSHNGHPSPATETPQRRTDSAANTPWSANALSSTKLDLRDIMSQASSVRTSSLSLGLSAQKRQEDDAGRLSTAKVSQKERKKQQQQAFQRAASQPQYTPDKSSPSATPASPWQVAGLGAKTSLKDVLQAEVNEPESDSSLLPQKAIPPLNLVHRRTASPDTRFAGQQRRVSAPLLKQPTRLASSTSASSTPQAPQQSKQAPPPLVPHSKSYTTSTRRAEPALQLSMSDIIGQQKREQDLIKEAVAKRSLQEIQEEQAFNEWWELESRRAQEEEAARLKASEKGSGGGGSSGRSKGAKRVRGGKGRGGDTDVAAAGRGRGRGRGQASASASGV